MQCQRSSFVRCFLDPKIAKIMTIPNRFDHATAAASVAEDWEHALCSHAEVNQNKKPFTIVIPPPNVTGALHLGHGLNNTLQDIVIRKKAHARF